MHYDKGNETPISCQKQGQNSRSFVLHCPIGSLLQPMELQNAEKLHSQLFQPDKISKNLQRESEIKSSSQKIAQNSNIIFVFNCF